MIAQGHQNGDESRKTGLELPSWIRQACCKFLRVSDKLAPKGLLVVSGKKQSLRTIQLFRSE
jgi:hypothetical protein